ncbi:hypothetical protein M407DRAFT_29196 [Tulasnella calospora MUT 4182]|uniref:Uncharacterized protein n=1 Tax=Tulasnella calospora MUT 4182 TaxID=1051891 RepID=A0A0C3QAK7_9AGAM|nr:hypothetical protein M407DRAFT_29196 [Tulasnella calospora MUT 4182]
MRQRETAKVHYGRNWLQKITPKKVKRSKATGQGSGNRARRGPFRRKAKNQLAACNTPQLDAGADVDADDLVSVDDDIRGCYWRRCYSSEIRRKSKGEASPTYLIERRGVNADGDYYEILKWRAMFGKQNTNTFRYWNNDGSFYESYPDCSDYYSKDASHERYISPKYGGFLRTKQSGCRMFKRAPFFESWVMERALNNTRGPGHVFQPPWIAERKANHNFAKQLTSPQHEETADPDKRQYPQHQLLNGNYQSSLITIVTLTTSPGCSFGNHSKDSEPVSPYIVKALVGAPVEYQLKTEVSTRASFQYESLAL